jgi:hypothetical protein
VQVHFESVEQTTVSPSFLQQAPELQQSLPLEHLQSVHKHLELVHKSTPSTSLQQSVEIQSVFEAHLQLEALDSIMIN